MKKTLLIALCMLGLMFTGFSQQTGPVRNLGASVDENDQVFLTWDFPEAVTHDEITLTWSNMVQNTWVGTVPTCSWDVMQHFDPMDVRSLAGWRIKSITCMTTVIDTVYNNPDGEFYVKIWKGEGPDLELMYQQRVEDPVGGEFQEVVLDEDVFVEEGQGLWIGLYGDQPFMYPWAIDGYVHAPDSKGIMLYLYNEVEGACVPTELIDYFGEWCGNACISATLSSPEAVKTFGEDPQRENGLTGYKVYRNGNLVQTIPYPFMTYFTDTPYGKDVDVEYCVTAVYGVEESESECVTASVSGVPSPEAGKVMMVPNPATSMVTVTGEGIREVEIHNLLGQRVASMEGHDTESLTVSLEGLPQGVYLVSVHLADGKRCEKKLVVH